MVDGPGPRKLVHTDTDTDADADWYLLVGDMTALPAISGNIELLPETAKGTAIIEVMDETDIQDLEKPPHFDVDWVVNPHPGQASHLLLERIKTVERAEGNPSVWVACEFSGLRLLRDYFRNERDRNYLNYVQRLSGRR